MSVTISFKNDNLPEGEEVSILGGLVAVENGGQVTLSKEQQNEVETLLGHKIKDVVKNSKTTKASWTDKSEDKKGGDT